MSLTTRMFIARGTELGGRTSPSARLSDGPAVLVEIGGLGLLTPAFDPPGPPPSDDRVLITGGW